MKLFKHIIKRLFQIVLLFCVFLIIYTLITETWYATKYGTSTATQDSEIIGTISVYSSPIDKFSLTRLTGHSWIYIENTSSSPFTINDIVINPGSGITFGTSGHPDLESDGVWFNIESRNSSYLENVSAKGNFYVEDLEQLEIYLAKHNKWNIIYNCATFASGVWNNTYVGSQSPLHAISPKGLRRQIKDIPNYQINEPFIFNYEMLPYKEKD